jgi:hypothetical protein
VSVYAEGRECYTRRTSHLQVSEPRIKRSRMSEAHEGYIKDMFIRESGFRCAGWGRDNDSEIGSKAVATSELTN